MGRTGAPVRIDPTLYAQVTTAAAEDGMDAEQLVERALRRTLALRAVGRLQAGSPWRELSEEEVMDVVMAEQQAARAERRAPTP